MVDGITKVTPVVRGGVISATNMDYTYGVAVSPDNNYVFVTRAYSAWWTASPRSPPLCGAASSAPPTWTVITEEQDGANGVAVSPDDNYMFVVGPTRTLLTWWTSPPRPLPWCGAASSLPPT